MFDKEITRKNELLEVIEALDKLDKNYVITKSKKSVQDFVPQANHEIKINVWHVKEINN